ncbi:MAG: LemA family protein [Actinobacteria bacterium]|nr:LemA family protein [Actinomycetota bacterium]
MALIIFLIILAIVVVGGVAFAMVAINNSVVNARNKVDEAWAQISVQLKRRHDLIPNLVSAVKGYASHEQTTLDNVIKARNAALGTESDPHAAAQAENQLSGALKGLFALSESYPDLKASQNFAQLQKDLVDTEDRIAFSRQYYNDVVRQWNTKIETIPYRSVARRMGAHRREYFQVEDFESARYQQAISDGEESKPPEIGF